MSYSKHNFAYAKLKKNKLCCERVEYFNNVAVQHINYFTMEIHHWEDWLFGWLGLWHINLCRLFKAKSIFIQIELIKVGDFSWGWPEGSLFNSYYTKV